MKRIGGKKHSKGLNFKKKKIILQFQYIFWSDGSSIIRQLASKCED